MRSLRRAPLTQSRIAIHRRAGIPCGSSDPRSTRRRMGVPKYAFTSPPERSRSVEAKASSAIMASNPPAFPMRTLT